MQKKHNINIRNPESIGIGDIDVYNTDKRKVAALQLKNKVKVKIRVGVFFDGTGNNGFNSDAIYYTKKLPLTQEDIKTEEHKGFDVETDTSYWNPYSNVKLLHDLYEQSDLDFTRTNRQDPHHYLQFPIYVEGIGTLRDKEDDLFGSGLGEGSRGVIARVNLACQFISDRIRNEFDKLIDIHKKSLHLESLQFDVFGFSRGAAAARHFCNEVLKSKTIYELKKVPFKKYTPKVRDKVKREEYLMEMEAKIDKVYYSNKQKIVEPRSYFLGGKLGEFLKEKNINYPKKNVHIEFLGVFDTVISQILEKSWIIDIARIVDTFTPDAITIPTPFTPIKIKNPVNFISRIKKVNPDVSHKHIKNVFHISAKSEWRENFPLTPIGRKENRKTLNVLGAHSDIGGGYWHTEEELKILHYFDVGYEAYNEGNEKVTELKNKLRKWYIDQLFCNDTNDEIRWETKHHIQITQGYANGSPYGDFKLMDQTFMGNDTEKWINGELYEIIGYHFQLVSKRKLDNRLSLVYMNVMKHIAKKFGGVPLNLTPSSTKFPIEYKFHSNYDLTSYQERMIKVADQIWENEKPFDPKIFRKENGRIFYKITQQQRKYIMKNFVHLSAHFNSTIPILDFFDHSDFAYANVPNMTFEEEFKEPPYEREHYTPVLAKFDKN
ncbi:DUF2235 domain-containing protein [uncultured Kordia sp.]|uniref:phospholipase effector Tle1 domain-containing protein n=1 Tax=uncultured Kordia sp. TaxID=507699 RepID=UPI00261B7CDE|nr:DUF2235 domain-containing protein [uncultured Kordia sp.]